MFITKNTEKEKKTTSVAFNQKETKNQLGLEPEEKTEKKEENAIVVKDVDKSFGSKKILNKINLTVKKGTIHGFVGPNGSGKTTTMKIIVKLTIASKGDVFIYGKSIGEDRFTNSHIGFCPAETTMMEDVETEDLILSYNGFRGLTKEYILQSLNNSSLKKYRFHKVKELSTGWRKIVQIFNITLSKPSILLLDEPFNGLDPLARRSLVNKLKELREKGTTVLLSTHILSDLQELADAFTIIKRGETIFSGKKTENIEETYLKYFASTERQQ